MNTSTGRAKIRTTTIAQAATTTINNAAGWRYRRAEIREMAERHVYGRTNGNSSARPPMPRSEQE